MSLACTGQGSTSFAFGGQIKYRFCNPSTDNELICGDCEPGLFSQSDEETCLPCPPGSYSAATAATSCANSCPTNTPYSQAASTSASQCSTPVCARNSYWGGPSTGLTCDNCPPYAPLAPPGSSDITDCFHVFASLFVVCSPNNRLIAYNSDEQQFQTLVESDQLGTPSSITFLTPTLSVVTLAETHFVALMDLEGNMVNPAAISLMSPSDTLHFPALDLLAVTSAYDDKIYFFPASSITTKSSISKTLGKADAVAFVFVGNPMSPFAISHGENPDEFLMIDSHPAATGGANNVVRYCVPNTACPNSRHGTILKRVLYGNNVHFRGFAVSPSGEGYFVVDSGRDEVRYCPFDQLSSNFFACTLWASVDDVNVDNLPGQWWDPHSIVIDAAFKYVYVTDFSYNKVHVFGLESREYFGEMTQTVGDINLPGQLALKPGFEVRESSATPSTRAVAGVSITVPLTLLDASSSSLPEDYDWGPEVSRFEISATGDIVVDGDTLASTIPGVVVAGDDPSIVIKKVGTWTVSMTSGVKNRQSFKNSPFKVQVDAGASDPSRCKSEFTKVLTAGELFRVRVEPFDIFANPSGSEEDRFFTEDGEELARVEGEGWFEHSRVVTVAGSHKVQVFHGELEAQTEVVNSPFHYVVNAAAPSRSESTHNLGDVGRVTSRNEDVKMLLKITPFDEFKNQLLAAEGYAVSIAGGEAIELKAPDYSHDYVVEAGFDGDLEISFTLGGEDLANSPVRVDVRFDEGYEGIAIIVGVCFAVGGLLGLGLFCKQQAKVREAEKNVAEMHKESRENQKQLERVEEENEKLIDTLRKKKHTEEELEVMRMAMLNLDESRSDELKGVCIDSSELKVEKLLGKGGFGVVNLATYRGGFVAAKQLLEIDEESVERFRFECFLMKNLRHPNIVKLIGVCWDDSMFACCLEFVSNGSLEDWLRKCWKAGSRDELCWRDKLIKTATECAQGVQYLHNERYWSDDDGDWRECIIHRDLKPDNMLLTEAWDLKLTDFGEARALNLNHTMTSVGTPIYVAPEVMKADTYTHKVDVYSFGICLVAMMRAERNIIDFFFESLRKYMHKANRKGLGITILNNYLQTRGWRPHIPPAFRRSYGKLGKLIEDCWAQDADKRPEFAEIVARLVGEVGEEVRRGREPDLVMLMDEDDALYIEEEKRLREGGRLVGGETRETGEGDLDRKDEGLRATYKNVISELTKKLVELGMGEDDEVMKLSTAVLREEEYNVETVALKEGGGDDKKVEEELLGVMGMLGGSFMGSSGM